MPTPDVLGGWLHATPVERGGVVWDGTRISYIKGDIVTENSAALGEEQLYVCTVDIIAAVANLSPSLDITNINWIEYDTY